MEHVAWYYIDAGQNRLFRPGEVVEEGDVLGAWNGSQAVRAVCSGTIAHIQYDIWRDQVILGIAPKATAGQLAGR